MTVRTAEGTSIDDSGTNADDADIGVSGVSETPLAPIAGESVAAWPPEDSPAILAKLGVGTIIEGKYRVDEVLGRGTMGVVVAATHLHLLESVALKFINVRVSSRGEDFRARFRREAQLSAKLRSEHIARVIDVGVWQGGEVTTVVLDRQRAALGLGQETGEALDRVSGTCHRYTSSISGDSAGASILQRFI